MAGQSLWLMVCYQIVMQMSDFHSYYYLDLYTINRNTQDTVIS